MLCLLTASLFAVTIQNPAGNRGDGVPAPATLGLEQGTLEFDTPDFKLKPYSGDYGPNFFGVAANAATYLVQHPEFGWQSFGGNIRIDGDWIKLKPLDAFGRRVFVAPRGLWLELDAGTFESIEVHSRTHAVRVGLSAANSYTPIARLRMDQPAKIVGVGSYRMKSEFTFERGAFTIPLQKATRWLELTDEVP
jgi:hypothetical protein